QYRDAAASFARATTLKPDLVAGYLNLGLARRQLGDEPAALAAFTQAARVAPRGARAQLQFGLPLNSLHRYAEAIAAFNQAITLAPDAAAYLGLGIADANVGQ